MNSKKKNKFSYFGLVKNSFVSQSFTTKQTKNHHSVNLISYYDKKKYNNNSANDTETSFMNRYLVCYAQLLSFLSLYITLLSRSKQQNTSENGTHITATALFTMKCFFTCMCVMYPHFNYQAFLLDVIGSKLGIDNPKYVL